MRSGWTITPTGRWTTTATICVGEYLALSAWVGGEWAITHKGERVAAWHEGQQGADLIGAMELAEQAAERLKDEHRNP